MITHNKIMENYLIINKDKNNYLQVKKKLSNRSGLTKQK